MKNFLILSYIILSLVAASCRKQAPILQIHETMTAKIEGKPFSASNFVVARVAQTTSINGAAGQVSTPESISIIIKNVQVGTFQLGETTHYAAYNSQADEFLSTSGQVVITHIQDDWIEGRFEFTAQSVNDPSLQVQITEGLFKLKID